MLITELISTLKEDGIINLMEDTETCTSTQTLQRFCQTTKASEVFSTSKEITIQCFVGALRQHGKDQAYEEGTGSGERFRK